jgi:hypothetical protein
MHVPLSHRGKAITTTSAAAIIIRLLRLPILIFLLASIGGC